MKVSRDNEGSGVFPNYTVEIDPEDIPTSDDAMVMFVHEHGDVVGLAADDLPAFYREVKHRYARRAR